MFPSLKDPEHANVRLKNVGRQVYLCVTQDATGNPVLGTKTLNDIVDPDGECAVRTPFGVLYVWGGIGFLATYFVPYISITSRLTHYSNVTLHNDALHNQNPPPNLIVLIQLRIMR
jgi:hypothetical protein